MEEIMKSKASKEWSARPPTLAMREDSHGILKPRPKVRIVHIFAPEIIKTDAANFRELVQRLTGNPKKTARPAMVITPEAVQRCKGSHQVHQDSWRGERIKEELERAEEEGEMWMKENSGGFLGGLGDVDGFFQGLGDFPLLPLTSSHLDVMGERV